jgi:uncharacterized membrane protein
MANSRRTQALGGLLVATGAAHFAKPEAFESISRLPFPEDTRNWVYRNGAAELALGLALTTARTRKLGAVGLAAYGLFLGSRVAANR